MTLAPSYAHGVSSVSLLGETIGAAFDRTVARYPDRPALIARQQGVRWTWREFGERVDAFAAGLLALGLQPGERIGIWSPNNAEWVVTQFATAKAGLILVNINPAYRLSELEYALNKVGCRALVTATAFKTSDYVGMINTLAPELRHARPGHLDAAKAAGAARRDPDRRQPRARHGPVRQRLCHGRGTAARAAAGAGEDAAIRRADQHPVHLRHHGPAEGRHADAPQHPEQRLLPRRGDALHRAGQGVHPGAAVSLLRHGDGQPGLHDARRGDGVSRRGVRSAGDAADGGRGALHVAVRRADHVHRRTGPSGVRQIRSVQPAHRHHGRRPLPDRGDAPLHPRHAPDRDHHRLRHDRDQPGQHPDRARRSDGAPRLHGRPRASACRGQDHRHRGPHRPARHAGRILHARLFGDARLLGRRGAHRRRRSTPRAGCTPATWRRWTPTATATSSAASRTW